MAHVQFEIIHPFLDGNGRLGRLLITLLLCEQKVLREPMLYLSLYFKMHRQYYYELLGRKASAHYQEETPGQPVGKHMGGSVLVMDDEEVIIDVASSILAYLGYKVTTCSNGEETIDHYKASMDSDSPFLAVIMDLTIPGGMGGKQAAERILSQFPDACLIVSSGYSNDPIMSNYRDYGFSGAITKPYNIQKFKEVLSCAIGDARVINLLAKGSCALASSSVKAKV